MKQSRNFIKYALVALLWMSGMVAYGQTTLSGVVTDVDQQPLPAVNILIKGTDAGTQTDFDGNFSIEVNAGDVLVFSSLGFKGVEITYTNQMSLAVVLEEDTALLDEVVLVGYNTQRRNTLATSVASLDTKVLESASRTNAATSLQGTIAGLRVTNTTGQPGSTPEIILRGGTTFEGKGEPLILIDGVPGSFYALNTDDIESMTVLKDAASTAIYGARAADGVILITTKTGKVGRSSVNYKFRYSINKERETPNYASAADFIKYNRQGVAYYTEVTGRTNFDNAFLHGATAFGTGGNHIDSPFTTQYLTADNSHLLNQPGWQTIPDPLDPSREILFMENDMGDLIYQNSYTNDHYLSFDGGNEKGTYYAGLGYLDNKGLTLGSGFRRFSGKFTGAYNITENFKVHSNVIYAHSNQSLSALGSDNWVFQRFAGQANTARIYNNNEDGTLSNTLNPGTNISFGNPLYYADKRRRTNLEQRLTLAAGFDWYIIDGLKFGVQASHFTINNHNESFNRAYLSGGNLNTSREASTRLDRTLQNQVNGILEYTKVFGEKHNFKALLGAEYFDNQIFSSYAATRNSPSDLIETLNAGSEANGVPWSFETEYRIVSQFLQVNYDYDSRYLVGLTARRDGASRLGKDNQYDIFPGVSFAWNLHNEGFYKGSNISNVLHNVKPRISYGDNGNIKTLSNFGVFGAYGDLGIYDGQTGYGNTSLPTPDLTWERSSTLNFGLDLGMFDNRLTIIADYFIRDVKDKHSLLTLPYWTGFSGVLTNNGTLRNKGLELQINGDVISNQDWRWGLGLTLYHVKSYVVDLPDNGNENNRQGGTQIWDPSTQDLKWVGGLQEGQRVGLDQVVAYVQDYVYADQAEVDEHAGRVDMIARNQTTRFPGDVAWKDLNGDNVIDFQDRKVIGRTTPDVVGGLTSNLSWKNFNLFIKTDWAMGHLIRNNMREKGLAQTQGNLNAFDELLDSWTPENTDTDVPRMVFVDPQRNHNRGSTRYWEKGDYLALREITLSYNFNSELFKDRVKALRVYLTGDNIHYFKSYSGDTPEIGGFQGGRFPMPRTFTMGLNITL